MTPYAGVKSYQHLLVKEEGDLTTIKLNRPEKRNALSEEVMREVTDALRAVGDSAALGVILAAEGPVFSAGHNFADMAGADPAKARMLFKVCVDMMDAVQAIPQPVDLDQHNAYAYTLELMAAGVVAPDGQEGITAFLEKRKPNYQRDRRE